MRPDRDDPLSDQDYIDLAYKISKSSHCLKRAVGTILVDRSNKRICASINGDSICRIKGCLREYSESGKDLDRCRAIHAEQRVILNMIPFNKENSVIYVTHLPCGLCAAMIIAVGIREVVYSEPYGEASIAISLFRENNISVRCLKWRD